MKKLLILLAILPIFAFGQVNLFSGSNSFQIGSTSYPLNSMTININRDTLCELDFSIPTWQYPFVNPVVVRNQSIRNFSLDGTPVSDTGTLRAWYRAHMVGGSGGGISSGLGQFYQVDIGDAGDSVYFTKKALQINDNVWYLGDHNDNTTQSIFKFDLAGEGFRFTNDNTSDNVNFNFVGARTNVSWQNGVDGTVAYLSQITGTVITQSFGSTVDLSGVTTLAPITDYEFNSSTGAVPFKLPTGTNASIGTTIIISDLSLQALTSNITIDAGAGNFIVGTTSAQTLVVNVKGAVVKIKKVTNTQWKVQ